MTARGRLRGVVLPPALLQIGPLVRAVYGVTSEKCLSGRAYVRVLSPRLRLRPGARSAWDDLYRRTSLRHTDVEGSDRRRQIEDLTFRTYDPRGALDAAEALLAFAVALYGDHAEQMEVQVPSYALFPDHPWEERHYPGHIGRERERGVRYLCDRYGLDPTHWEMDLEALYARQR